MQLVHHIYSTNISIDYIFIICHVDGLVRARPRPGEALDPLCHFPGHRKKGAGLFWRGAKRGVAWQHANSTHWAGLGLLPTPPTISPSHGRGLDHCQPRPWEGRSRPWEELGLAGFQRFYGIRVRVGRVPKVLRY
ncbi:ICP22 [anatid alphaherpesvirus 1]|uniref:ICP22 n=1 Tax=anatid alphaherpesvirus 1 TaxID=104388 RepID=H9DV37_9ALPH|nr:ICP22 [Anatid alphaherpesvirus 1]